MAWASSLLPVRVLGWCRRLVRVVQARLASPVLLAWQARVVQVLPVSVVCRPRWPPVLVVLVVLPLVVLVVWLARSAPAPVLVVDLVHTVRVVVCRVMHTRALLVRRVLLLVVRWVLARVLSALVLVWALVVVLQVSVLVRQALQASCRVRQRLVDLLPVLRLVVVAVV
ncbi:hypothetical protein [Corynebacterium sp. HMSC071B10]|uniref:hypothetical protein n=1 Tax=Corynebacterium sp. HMSC071B10 TaxID=1739494 RepID=UPI00143B4015|nr:hypothetical protein [Corynebacterium sp. HMSC071B10]